MKKNTDNTKEENPVQQQPSSVKNVLDKNNVKAAHDEAEKDISKDPDLNHKPAPEDGLDEGELARLEGED